MWYSLELCVLELVLRTNLDEGALVARAVAVVRCRENSNAASIVLDFVALHAHLVRSNNSLESVPFTKALCDVRTKLETDTALARSASGCCLRVGPEHFHHQARLAWLSLLESIKLPDIIQCDVVVREEAAMENKVLLANKCGEGK